MNRKCEALVSRPRETRVIRRCGKDAVAGDTYCERHRHDPLTRDRQAQWVAILRPDWDVALARLDEKAAREAERAARNAQIRITR